LISIGIGIEVRMKLDDRQVSSITIECEQQTNKQQQQKAIAKKHRQNAQQSTKNTNKSQTKPQKPKTIPNSSVKI
jgi:hypothetical protein